MAKRNIVKKSTVDQIEKLIKEHGVVGMMDTDEYKNMINRNFLNKLEKDNMRTIIAMVNDGKSYDEIRFIVEGGEHSQNKSDPVEQETETLINMTKYVKDKKPEIVIGGVDDVEEKPEEVERVEPEKVEANDNTVQVQEEPADNVILLKDIIEEKKTESEEKVQSEESVKENDCNAHVQQVIGFTSILSKIIENKKAEESEVKPDKVSVNTKSKSEYKFKSPHTYADIIQKYIG